MYFNFAGHLNITGKRNASDPTPNVRKSSCGVAGCLKMACTLDSETLKDIYSSASKPNDFNLNVCESCRVNKFNATKCFANSESVLTSHSSLHESVIQRRSSLPCEVSIATALQAPKLPHLDSKARGEQFFISKNGREASTESSFLLDHDPTRSDLISVLIGPSGMLNSMQGIVGGRTICELPCTAQETSRRRSGGLEMLSSIWKSRTNDVIIGVSMASKLKLRSQILENWASWRTEENVKLTEGANSSISALDPQIIYQQRRGSVPLNISLLSLSSGK